MFRLFDVSKSGYYDWLKRKPSQQACANAALDQQIQRIYGEHSGRYGYRRVRDELLDLGYHPSRERVRRRMKRLCLKGIQTRKFKHTTHRRHGLALAPNLLKQDFVAAYSNQKWVGDITYIRVDGQWLYLAVVLDLYSRKVVGWAFSKHIDAPLVCAALKFALRQRGYPKDVVMHTDQGSQYASDAYQKLLRSYGLRASMSGKGNCYDNAVCESFFHTLKVEHVYRLRFESMEHAKQQIFWFIEAYYNSKRKHSALNYKSPNQFERLTDKIAA